MFRQRLFAKRVKRSATLRITLNFSATSDEGRGYITLRDVHVRRAFSRLPRCILLPFPSGWNSIRGRANGDLEEYSRQQDVPGCKVVNLH